MLTSNYLGATGDFLVGATGVGSIILTNASDSFNIPSVAGNCSAWTFTLYLAELSVFLVFSLEDETIDNIFKIFHHIYIV